MGDTDPPKFNVLAYKTPVSARTTPFDFIEEISRVPAPDDGGGGETKTPATAATEAGEITKSERNPQYHSDLRFSTYRVTRDLLVEVGRWQSARPALVLV